MAFNLPIFSIFCKILIFIQVFPTFFKYICIKKAQLHDLATIAFRANFLKALFLPACGVFILHFYHLAPQIDARKRTPSSHNPSDHVSPSGLYSTTKIEAFYYSIISISLAETPFLSRVHNMFITKSVVHNIFIYNML